MNFPQDDNRRWYEEHIVAQIEDAEVRAVAAVLNFHYGKANRTELEALCLQVWGSYTPVIDRKCRDICEILTTIYHFPVGSSAGCSGRWRARPDEIEAIKHENTGRINSLLAKNAALDAAIFPPEEIVIPVNADAFTQASLF